MKAHLLAASALVAAVVFSVSSARPALAVDPGGPVVVDRSTGWNSDEFKPKEAFCPENTNLIGTGATGAGANTIVDDLIPYSDHVAGLLWEDETATTADSQLTVRAVCAEVTGYEIVADESDSSSSSPKSAVAHCSSEARDLLGTGYKISNGFGQVMVTKVVPYAAGAGDEDSVTVTAYEDDSGFSGTWSVTAYAICGYALGSTTVESSSTTQSSSSTQGKSQTCAPDRFNTGSGAAASAGLGNIHLSPFMPASHYGGVDLMNATAYEDADGTPVDWKVTLYAICVVL